jgi:hypothetical protein
MKNLKKIAIAIFAVTLFSVQANAQVSKSSNPNNFTVKYTGSEDGYLCFNVTMPTTMENNLFIKVEDKVEGELYGEQVKAATTTLKFRIEKKAGQELLFKLFEGKNVYEKSFTTNTKLVEQVIEKNNEIASLNF